MYSFSVLKDFHIRINCKKIVLAAENSFKKINSYKKSLENQRIKVYEKNIDGDDILETFRSKNNEDIKSSL